MADLDLDLDAIRARLADNAVTSPLGIDFYAATDVDPAVDVLIVEVRTLLARLAEVQAERDAETARADAYRADLEATTAELDGKGPCIGMADLEKAQADNVNLAAENARLRQRLDSMVEDATDWARAHRYYTLRADLERVTAERDELRRVIRRVLDRHASIHTLCEADEYELATAYRAGQKAPAPADLAEDETYRLPDLAKTVRTGRVVWHDAGPGDTPGELVPGEDDVTAEPTAADPPGLEALRERLAAIEHERWAHWQRYMHSLCERTEDEARTVFVLGQILKQGLT